MVGCAIISSDIKQAFNLDWKEPLEVNCFNPLPRAIFKASKAAQGHSQLSSESPRMENPKPSGQLVPAFDHPYSVNLFLISN